MVLFKLTKIIVEAVSML